MFMNSDLNSNSKQCPESKLGQVHSVHTPKAKASCTLHAGPVVSWRTRRRVVAFPWSYRSLCPAMSWSCCRCVAVCTGALARRVAAPCRSAVSQRRVATQGRVAGPFQSRYKICIATLAPAVRALLAVSCVLSCVSQASLAVSRARSAISWPYPAVLRPPPGVPRPACLLNLLCACSAFCVPARPAVCLLGLLCACSACCVPHSLLYCNSILENGQ